MKLTEKQVKFAYIYAKKAKVDPEWLLEQLEKGKTTFKELQQGILGVRVG